MATLISPGIDVQITDESFYGTAGAGTIPLIVIATASNKLSPSGTGYAPYTVPSEAGKLFIATSQRELIQNFGNPKFYSVQGTQLHGYELNEYGLHAAYQYLGVSNRVMVLRADVDLAQLEPSDTAPRGEPVPGTYWLDTSETEWGLFQSNGNSLPGSAWVNRSVLVLSEGQVTVGGVPQTAVGTDGQFAIVVANTANKFFEKTAGAWNEIGSAAWKAAHPTIVRSAVPVSPATEGATFFINGTEITVDAAGTVASIAGLITTAAISNITATVSNGALVITNTAGGNITIAAGTTPGAGTPALTTLGISAKTYKGVEVKRTNDAQYPANSVSGDIWIKGAEPNKGMKWKVKFYNAGVQQWIVMTAQPFPYDSTKSDGDATKDLAAFQAMGVPSTGVVYVGYDNTTGVQTLRRWSGSRWEDLVYEASATEPSSEAEDGTMWFSTDFRTDFMVSNGEKWEGYRVRYPFTDPEGCFLSGSAPLTQSDGTPLVDNDLWIDTTDLENYPALYRYDATALRWKRVDVTDQTTPFGIIFADMRQDSGTDFTNRPVGSTYVFNSEKIEDLLVSDFVDPDAPDPRTVPSGMLCMNTRYSTYNVKEWKPRWFKDGNFDPNTDYTQDTYTVGGNGGASDYVFPALGSAGRWVTKSGNKLDGSPYMGRKAQRVIVTRAMSAVVQNNEDLLSEFVYFNLMAAPGYPEMVDELMNVNLLQKEVAFIVADTPPRLKPQATAIKRWAKNENLAGSTGEDGLATAYTYLGVYYPWGLSTNVDGSEIMIPPSTIALRTMAYNDQVAYPWFAPAGFQRGLVTNATSVGYLTDEGEFKPVLLNPGQRDTLYENKINPIAFIPNRGLVVYGQKTLHPLESALDRVNVARLANYLKYNLDNLMKPFLFEQNDQQTRDSARLTVERFLSGLITLRALEDYAVLCDETNNTPARRDRNELWVDILIKPIKAIEFIYVPVRIRNSGDTLTLAGV